MLRRENFPQLLGAATLALFFSAATVHPQATTDTTPKGSSALPSSGASGAAAANTGAPAGGNSPAAATAPADKSTTGTTTGTKSAKAGSVSKSDVALMREMAYANLSEIEAGKLAQSKSKNENVRNFAQKMVDDHTKAQGELQQLAQAKGVTLPTKPDAKHKAAMDKLGKLSGAAFDSSYMKNGGVNDHEAAHKLVARVKSKAADADLKALADKTLPTIDDHLAMAKDLNKGGKAATASGSSGTSSSGKSGTSSSGKSSTSGKSPTTTESGSAGPGVSGR
jgi:putative membrane protein